MGATGISGRPAAGRASRAIGRRVGGLGSRTVSTMRPVSSAANPQETIRELELFAGLDPRLCDALTLDAPEADLDEGQEFDVASTSAVCCLVAHGRLALAVIDEGRERTISILEDGDVLVRPMDSWATVGPGVRCYAIQSSRMLLVDRQRLDAWMDVPVLATSLVRVLADAVADRELALAIALEPTVERRLLLKLRQLAERWGSVTPDGIRLDLRLTHQELANMVGVVRETVTIALGRLAESGEIEVRNRTLLIRIPERGPSQRM